jgi:peptide deformylase
MAVRRIRIYGDPVLRVVADPVENIDDKIKDLAQDMIDTMYANDGVGLAANQVGVTKQIFVMDPRDNENEQNPVVLLNPVIKNLSGSCEMEEGCLSIPDIRSNVKRADSFDFEAQTLNGEKMEFRAEGLLARVICHEVDHLNGKLFIDYLSPVRKMMLKDQLKQLEKQSKKESEAVLS